jgi:hypothetical protein
MNNTIIENNLNSNDSPDCDTHLVNSESTMDL